ncbi:MAG TPA: hypothetical protein VLL73_08280, partial [Desulfurivibrionaceae bacterium]|nr:hypothetical protein [Desulfurivibrionaceae bacterium]
RPMAFGTANISKPCRPNMKVIWTLKNSPNPHIQAKATELPHSSELIQRKFITKPKEPAITASGKAGLTVKSRHPAENYH